MFRKLAAGREPAVLCDGFSIIKKVNRSFGIGRDQHSQRPLWSKAISRDRGLAPGG
jgi:hypothetical protein